LPSVKPRILIIDDDVGLRETIADFIEGQGFEPIEAPDASSARLVIAQADLVLLDLTLPDADGLVLAAELKTLTQAPIILMSGRGHAIGQDQANRAGASSYLPKPFQLRELLALMRKMLGRSP
jgi:DNA-binding response OmpR family regulator